MPQRLHWILAAAVALGFGLTAPALAIDVDGPDDCLRDLEDMGDAPDGLQPTLAYPGVFGHFPTCFMPTPPGTQELPCGVATCPPPAYTGYVWHRQGPGGYWLGCGPPFGAPQGIDSDPTGKFNDNGGAFSACDMQPPTTTVDTWLAAFGINFGQDEGYGDSDAGLAASPTFYTGLVSSVTFKAYNCGPPRDVLLNILVDWSHDGDWCDNVLLPGGACVTEWPVINQFIHLPTGCSTITSPSFGTGATPGPAWMRITISSTPATSLFPWNGSAGTPMDWLEGGETEDYPVEIQDSGLGSYEDWGDAPESVPAYASGVPGNFPTCFNPSGMGTQQIDPGCQPVSTVPGVTGYMRHSAAAMLLPIWLGCGTQQPPNWGFDSEADGKLNLLAAPGTPSICNPAVLTDCVETPLWGPYGQDECYGDLDAGITSPIVFQPCVPQSLSFFTMNLLPQAVPSVINVMVDWNGDGDWNDVFMCPGGLCAPEWAVKNAVVLVLPGCSQLQTPPILPSYQTGDAWLRITLTHTILPDDAPWNGSAGVLGGLYEDGETEDYPVVIQGGNPCGQQYEDFGDAPEDVLAYPSGVTGRFPTCVAGSAPGDQIVQCGAPVSPPPLVTGFVRHYSPPQDPIQYWLGCGDQLSAWGIDAEADGKMNQLLPVTPSACNQAILPDCWESAWGGMPFGQDECFGDLDAGVPPPGLGFGQCTLSQFSYLAFNCLAVSVPAYLNVLVDFNQDGDWNDLIVCPTIQRCADEWAVQNLLVLLGPGCGVYNTPLFQVGPKLGPAWLRLTLSDAPVPLDFPWNGSVSAPNSTLERGETEDYPVEIVSSPIDVSPTGAAPGLRFGPALPNPARDYSTLRYALPEAGEVRIAVYDAAGRLVRELVSGARPAGEHSLSWDYRDVGGARVPAGVYPVRLEFGGRVLTQRLVRVN